MERKPKARILSGVAPMTDVGQRRRAELETRDRRIAELEARVADLERRFKEMKPESMARAFYLLAGMPDDFCPDGDRLTKRELHVVQTAAGGRRSKSVRTSLQSGRGKGRR